MFKLSVFLCHIRHRMYLKNRIDEAAPQSVRRIFDNFHLVSYPAWQLWRLVSVGKGFRNDGAECSGIVDYGIL